MTQFFLCVLFLVFLANCKSRPMNEGLESKNLSSEPKEPDKIDKKDSLSPSCIVAGIDLKPTSNPFQILDGKVFVTEGYLNEYIKVNGFFPQKDVVIEIVLMDYFLRSRELNFSNLEEKSGIQINLTREQVSKVADVVHLAHQSYGVKRLSQSTETRKALNPSKSQITDKRFEQLLNGQTIGSGKRVLSFLSMLRGGNKHNPAMSATDFNGYLRDSSNKEEICKLTALIHTMKKVTELDRFKKFAANYRIETAKKASSYDPRQSIFEALRPDEYSTWDSDYKALYDKLTSSQLWL